MSGVPVVLSGVPVDIPESFPLPHAELTGPETLSYRRCRRPLRAILAAEVEVWRGALRAVRGMSRQSAVASVTSGLICGLVMFVFCVVFSNMIFGQSELLIRAVPLGVGTQTMTTMIGALVFARFSGCRAVIAGPDINPVVFLAEAAKTIVTVVCPDGGSEACDDAHKAVPTVMMAGLVATLMVGLVFLTLGRFRMTVIVGFIPSNVVAGFLSCIGYKVLNPTPVPIPAPIPIPVPVPIPIPIPIPIPVS